MKFGATFLFLATLLILIIFFVSSLIFWGLGVLIINVFEINYTWSFLHGICTTIIVSILSSIFKR